MVFVVAIDGLSGSGKGTLARKLSEFYAIKWLDTGKLYRMVALEALRLGCLPDDLRLIDFAGQLSVDSLSAYSLTNLAHETIGAMASAVSRVKEVRAALLDVQRSFAASGKGAILDGRDIGSVVCPDSDYKIFVYAELDIRAQRRYSELTASGVVTTVDSVRDALRKRDDSDMTREVAPLVAPAGAYFLDTSYMDADSMTRKAIEYIEAGLHK